MATVIIEGVFMGAQLKTTTFDGNSKTNLYVDVYQPNSDLNEKTVQLKTDDVAMYQALSKDYDMGSIFKVRAAVNAYKNKAYFKLIEVVS